MYKCIYIFFLNQKKNINDCGINAKDIIQQKMKYTKRNVKNSKFWGWFLFYHKTVRKDKANKRMEATDGSHQLDNKKKIHFLQRFS